MKEAPAPGWGRGPRIKGPPAPHPSHARGGTLQEGRASQRQRIDMTRPATMAPKPIAKFHADSETMNGMRSPAT